MSEAEFSSADIEYIRANYRRLEKLCLESGQDRAEVDRLIRATQLPAPSYVLPGGEEMVPHDYFQLVKEAGGPESLRDEFERRYRAAGGAEHELAADWEGYMEGVYGVCLRQVSPETIVRKSELVTSIEGLLAEAKPTDAAWQTGLRQEVQELDRLEREFSPDYDRSRFGTPPSRDRLIAVAHERYSEIFAEASVHRR
jgi:hypothetical protein